MLQKIKKISFVLLLYLVPAMAVLAQPNARLRFTKDLPKDLFTARTAVIINPVTTQPGASTSQKYEEITEKLKKDNNQFGFNLVHFSNSENLSTQAGMQDLAGTLTRLNVQKLFLLDYVNLAGTGSQENYKLVITPYNKTATLVSENQTAFSLQADSYERLATLLVEQIGYYSSGFFDKSAGRNAATSQLTIQEFEKNTPLPTTGLKYPVIHLATEDQGRGTLGMQHNFYYTIEGQPGEKNAGFFGQRLRQDIEASETALMYLNRYRSDKWGYLAGWTFIAGSIIGYSSQVYQENGVSYFNNRQKVFAGIALAATFSNILITRNTNRNFKKAVDEYNLFAYSRGKTGFRYLKPGTIQLGAMPQPVTGRAIPSLTLTWKTNR